MSTIRLLSIALITGVAACGGGDLTLPGDGGPSSLQAISGGGQEGTVGSELPKPLVVRLTDGAARPVRGASLRFEFQGDVPAAKISPATIQTNDTGFAFVQVRLGNTPGEQMVVARLADDTSNGLSTSFALRALEQNQDDGDGGRGRGRGRGNDDEDDDDD